MTVPLQDQRLDEVDFCIIDLETTGFSPYEDEILEIACLRVAPDGTVIDGFSSLIRPSGPVSGTEVHGIGPDDVVGAPVLFDVSGHVARCLRGAVLVSWNIYFDYPFMKKQLLEPLGLDVDVPRLCCMYLRGLTGRQPSRIKLTQGLTELGVEHGEVHRAHDDAMGTALLLASYLKTAREQADTFGQLAERGDYKFLASWAQPLAALPDGLPEGRLHGRYQRTPTPTQPPADEVVPLSGALRRVWARWEQLPTLGEEAYVDCLCAALADRRITPSDMSRLTDCARFYELGNPQRDDLHQRLYEAVIAQAEEDGVVTEAEAEDLGSLAGLLGVVTDDVVLSSPLPSPEPERVAGAGAGAGAGAEDVRAPSRLRWVWVLLLLAMVAGLAWFLFDAGVFG